MTDTNLPCPLTPYTYPLWIRIGIAICLLFFFVCMIELPFHFKVNNRVKNANVAFVKGNYRDAGIQYAELSFLVPKNKAIKIRAAESFFKSARKEDHLIAMSFLESISLNKKEWNELIDYMPNQYIPLFKDVKVKS